MKVKDIQDLLGFIATSGLNEVNLKTQEIELHVKRSLDASVVSYTDAPVPMMRVLPPVASASTEIAAQPPKATSSAEGDTSKYATIKSPMVGTFYTSPAPDAPPFVQIGDVIKVGKVVCIIEAMKLFNEIESDVAGRIVKILVENATPVEYEQPLFLVDTNA